ncbi:iron chaperone [Actinoplanes sp. NPDC049668]|uniref:iron chaperone n=1 Tax=unclassified Actinoplanes TaxID=2626549 RepID=UPI0033A0D9C4
MGEVTDYIAGRDEPARSLLERYRVRAMAVVPEAEEGKGYGMAALRYRGRPLISVVSTKQGYSVFPFSADVVAAVVAELDGFDSTKGGIRFTDERHLPDAAFEALVTRRQAEIDTALEHPRRG